MPLPYSDRNAATGSLLAAFPDGSRPPRSVRNTLNIISTVPYAAGREALRNDMDAFPIFLCTGVSISSSSITKGLESAWIFPSLSLIIRVAWLCVQRACRLVCK